RPYLCGISLARFRDPHYARQLRLSWRQANADAHRWWSLAGRPAHTGCHHGLVGCALAADKLADPARRPFSCRSASSRWLGGRAATKGCVAWARAEATEGPSMHAPVSRDELLAIERAAVAAWPALETADIDGWLWRYSGGGSQRANSVSPLRFRGSDVEGAIATAEARYRARGATPMFQICDVNVPVNLDQY